MIKLFELTPLGEFFFGGEATFGPDENRHYYVRSNLWPQQTSLLGLLRYELLKSDPAAFDLAADRIINKAAAAELVGIQGFDGATDRPFGIIEALSPVFLLDENRIPHFLQARLALQGARRTWVEKKSEAALSFSSENLLQERTGKQAGYQLMCERLKKGNVTTEPYDGKTAFDPELVGANGQRVPVYFDKSTAPGGVFIRVEKTGNRKNYSGATDDSGFYKQDMFKLRGGWRFAFLAAFNAALPAGFSPERKTHFGAERRSFFLKASDPVGLLAGPVLSGNVFQAFETLYGGAADLTDGLGQVVLLSDTRVSPEVYGHTGFALTETTPFRHFRPSLGHPNALWLPGLDPKSSRYTLLCRGSSLYAHNTTPLETHLANNAPAFRRIGYNYFKTFNP